MKSEEKWAELVARANARDALIKDMVPMLEAYATAMSDGDYHHGDIVADLLSRAAGIRLG